MIGIITVSIITLFGRLINQTVATVGKVSDRVISDIPGWCCGIVRQAGGQATVRVIEIAVIAGFDTIADAIAAESNRARLECCTG